MPFRGPLPLKGPEGEEPEDQFSEHENELLDKVAKKVVHWKMSVPAIVALESVKPLNYIGSQAMVFFEPMVQAIFNIADYDTFRKMMERRESIEMLLQRIEHYDAFAARKEKLFKKLKKRYLKDKSFGFRLKTALIGFKVPEELRDEWKARMDELDAEAEATHPAGPKSGDTKEE
jgi:hypothetical protein